MANNNLKFLGRGLKHPFRFSKAGALGVNFSSSTSEGIEHVKECLHQLLRTNIGERVMLRSFGSNLGRLVFEPQDNILIQEVLNATREAVRIWEKRVQIISIDILEMSPKDGRIVINMSFQIINTNVVGNLVYPFYLNPVESGKTLGGLIESGESI